MKCPLAFHYGVDANGRIHRDEGVCLEERCAWWLVESGRCVMISIPYELWEIHNRLGYMQEGLKK